MLGAGVAMLGVTGILIAVLTRERTASPRSEPIAQRAEVPTADAAAKVEVATADASQPVFTAVDAAEPARGPILADARVGRRTPPVPARTTVPADAAPADAVPADASPADARTADPTTVSTSTAGDDVVYQPYRSIADVIINPSAQFRTGAVRKSIPLATPIAQLDSNDFLPLALRYAREFEPDAVLSRIAPEKFARDGRIHLLWQRGAWASAISDDC